MVKSLRFWIFAALFSCIIMMVFLTGNTKTPTFTPPDFDPQAHAGIPVTTGDVAYVSVEFAGYQVGMTRGISLQNDKAYIFFTNFSSNDVWMKLRIYDSAENILGESGLIKPDEYIEYISLKTDICENEVIVKVMCYEPETYYSAGSVQISVPVVKIS